MPQLSQTLLQKMAPNFLSLNFAVKTYLMLVTMPPFSNASIGEQYKVCSSPVSCGPIKDIPYPFWLENKRPEFCGTPLFRLSCYNSSDYPDIWGFGRGNRVLSINTSSHTIVVDRDKNDTCHAIENSGQSFLIDGKSFLWGENIENLTLSLGCPNNTTARFHNLSCPCPSLDVNVSVYYLDKGMEAGSNCQSNIKIPVSKRALDEFIHNENGWTLESVLEEQFEVQYSSPNFEACSACQRSGGVCGSSVNSPSDQFVCYHPDKKRVHFGLILGLAFLIVGMCTLIFVASHLIRKSTIEFSALWRGKATCNQQNIEAGLKMSGSLAPRRYTYANIKGMTNSFTEKLGEGGYAVVYKGELIDGRPVAVKLLKESKGNNGEEFINEVVSMSRTNHVNIVTLLGFCFNRNKRALVYEFMPNGSLDKYTHQGNNNHHQSLPWKTIFDIAIGIARGLEYLHRGCNTRILHFDIKPHNILLDDEFHPKISDFGLARLCRQKESTISMLEARGTIGYIAPEVFCRNFGGVSHKSDVYSYGMMVVDLIGGRRSYPCVREVEGSTELCFSQWIYDMIEHGYCEIEEDGITSDERELQRKMLLVSLWCIQTYPSNRPSIGKVVEMLEGPIELTQMPPKPFLYSPPRLAFDSSSCHN